MSHQAKLRAFAKLPLAEQARQNAAGEAHRQELAAAWDAARHIGADGNYHTQGPRPDPSRWEERIFRPINNALIKVGDLAVQTPFVPGIVSQAYKAFAPPGSQYYSGSGALRMRRCACCNRRF